MRIVTGDEDIVRLAEHTVANPLWRVFWLKVARRRERSEGVAGAPECFGRLTGAKLAAVPDDGWTGATRRGFGRKPDDVFATFFGKRAPRIDVWPDRIAVMNKIKDQYAFSPARIRTFRRFSGSGMGQVV